MKKINTKTKLDNLLRHLDSSARKFYEISSKQNSELIYKKEKYSQTEDRTIKKEAPSK